MKKRLVLGDVHGHYEDILDIYNTEQPDEVILLGDYVDSFTVTPAECKKCLETLLTLQAKHNKKHKNKSFHMLLGNHDFHYIDGRERYSGWNPKTHTLCSNILYEALADNSIEIAYVDEANKTIYSHAGVSQTWADEWIDGSIYNINSASFNSLRFTYGTGFDPYGDNKHSSPIWIRPASLGFDMYKDDNEWRQVVGHTHLKRIVDFTIDKFSKDKEHVNLILCDTLPCDYIVETLDDDKIVDINFIHVKDYEIGQKQ